jgi:hypothetical protein
MHHQSHFFHPANNIMPVGNINAIHPSIVALRRVERESALESIPHTAYQIDYVAVNCGKVVATSKRNIRFKFGYTDLEKLSSGLKGQDCRGAEHEVLVEWSLSSGKKAIVFDGKEVAFNIGIKGETKLKHSWKDPWGHLLELEIHAANVSTKREQPRDWKQYDLHIDGVSFFRMPKIFEIGVKPSKVASSPTQDGSKDERFPTLNVQDAPPMVADLLSFDDDNAQLVVAPQYNVPQVYNNYELPAQQSYGTSPFSAPTNPFDYQTTAPTASPGVTQYYAPTASPGAYMPNSSPGETYAPNASPGVTQNYPNASPGGAYAPNASPGGLYAPNANPGMTQNIAAPSNPFDAFPMQPSPTASPGMNNYAPTTYLTNNNNAFGEPSYVNPSPGESYQPQANIVTPNTSSSAFVQTEQAPSTTADYGVPRSLVNMDDIFAYQNKPVQAQQTNNNGHASLGQLQGSKQTVMNNYNAAPMQQQPQYQQQQQYQGGFSGYQQPQQPQFNQFAQQPSYAQPGFGYQ